jgi:hypothetical protein
MDTSGKWQIVRQYDVPRLQSATLEEGMLADSEELSDPQQNTCEANPCNVAEVKKRMAAGVERAANCLPDFGDRGVDLYMRTYNVLERNMRIRCAPIPGEPQATIQGWDNPNGRLTVTVDPVKYCALNTEQREWILYHEILHAGFQTAHDPDAENLPEEQRKQLDRVYGCMALCYNNKADPTKCMCAQCFGTITCDPICAAFKSDCGATCPCPDKNDKYYNTCSSCLADCPSGLNCFGYVFCEPVGHSPLCEPPPTCP